MTTSQQARRQSKLVRAIIYVACAFIALLMFRSCHREGLWKWRVHRKLNADALRAWSSQARAKVSLSNSRIPWEMLRGAPAYLTNIEPVKVVAPLSNCVMVCYGKVGKQWGLAIGETNAAVPGDLKKASVETWAPGIYYWRE